MIIILLPEKDYDPTEAAVIWKAIHETGIRVQFATPEGKVAFADKRLTTIGFGFLSPLLMTRKNPMKAYNEMIESKDFQQPISYLEVDLTNCQGIYIPGGHAEGIKTLLESNIAQHIVVQAFKRNLPVGCVCHGLLLLVRSIDPETGKSVLFGRKTTGLIRTMELGAWLLTALKLGNYYRTYSASVESQVKRVLASKKDFKMGSILPFRDSHSNLKNGFTVRDGNYISARWPGDCYRLASEFVELLRNQT